MISGSYQSPDLRDILSHYSWHSMSKDVNEVINTPILNCLKSIAPLSRTASCRISSTKEANRPRR